METKSVEAEDGWFKCPDCNRPYDKVDSLRDHTERVHGFKISVYKPVHIPIEARRERGKRYTAAWRERRRGRKSKRIKSKGTQRAPFDIDDAKLHGTHGCFEPFVEYRTSLIEGAGNGIFAVEDLYPGDVVTWFAGPKTTNAPQVRTHTIQFEEGVYIDGLRQPVFGDGLGSFINRESRKLPKTRKNCEFVREGDMMAVEITKKIKAGQELYTTYSHGYRIRGTEY